MFSSATRQVFEHARQFLEKRTVPVLIEGESGTGKELVARYLHCGDTTRNRPFIALNCAAMSAELFQSELFGYASGAFTGARSGGSPGKLALAQGGTLFLDEISAMPLDIQARLLRVVETREYYRVGGIKKCLTDARFVFATNHPLAEEVARGRFRRDLYYRINVGYLVLPPLRQRRVEILPLAEAFLAEFNDKHGRHVQNFTAEARHYLYTRAWEGNVRELRNMIERAVILARSHTLTVADLDRGGYSPATATDHHVAWTLPPEGFDLEKHELELVRQALHKHHGNKTRTARYLRLSLKALQSRLRKL
jgi:transcriptional regulator with PAS, ATPase and Fis domain